MRYDNSSFRPIKYSNTKRVQIGQPAFYPTKVVEELKKLFSKRKIVKRAFLGWLFDPSDNVQAHLIFGIDIEKAHDKNRNQEIFDEDYLVIKPFLKKDELIDFIQIDENIGICNYLLRNTTPFFSSIETEENRLAH